MCVCSVQVILQTALIDELAMLTSYSFNITAGMTFSSFSSYKSNEALNKIAYFKDSLPFAWA